MLRSIVLATVLTVATTQAATAMDDMRKPGSSIPDISVSKVEPSSAAPGDRITITGLQFMPGARVWLGGAEATDVQVENAERMTLTVPDQKPGKAAVMIRNPDGRKFVRARTFTYRASAG